ncbi:PREDICTED: radial spoke head 10 homolog B-like isoform X2 [Priapulus caudatus]|uniref:Radial spoke head 10 homolog B-like isoform X2 n=1 Tax=Priapulus caudatus TaxID=37621 RepID=A0ABM1EPQ8_PRICU|nr:PREDICTED: radial spoke head 10 homolog B-like isoform X2 [Priapulus caudatus]
MKQSALTATSKQSLKQVVSGSSNHNTSILTLDLSGSNSNITAGFAPTSTTTSSASSTTGTATAVTNTSANINSSASARGLVTIGSTNSVEHVSKGHIDTGTIQETRTEQNPDLQHEKIIVERYEGKFLNNQYHGYGVALFCGGHKYEGHFKFGKMEGSGTYTWNEKCIYEGDFTCNTITGRGKYIWPDGSTYEGEVLNGLRQGQGVFRSPTRPCLYVGEWSKGKRHGKGKVTYNSDGTSYYDGEWKQSELHGHGLRRYSSGNVYEGEWYHGKRQGKGKMHWVNIGETYTGDWHDGFQHGNGVYEWRLSHIQGSQYPITNSYYGYWIRGQCEGYGIFCYASGAKYEGQWQDSMKHGLGKMTFKNGSVHEGQFQRDKILPIPDLGADVRHMPAAMRAFSPRSLAEKHTGKKTEADEDSPVVTEETILQAIPQLPNISSQIHKVQISTTRYIGPLRSIYNFYADLGSPPSDNSRTSIMTKMQLWRLLLDCRVHHKHLSLARIDKLISTPTGGSGDRERPSGTVLFRQLLTSLVILAFHLLHDELAEGIASECSPDEMLSKCMEKLLQDHLLPYACCVQGQFYTDPGCQKLGILHQFLTANRVLEILSVGDPAVGTAGSYNIEREMTFLDFVEAILLCAEECGSTIDVAESPSNGESQQHLPNPTSTDNTVRNIANECGTIVEGINEEVSDTEDDSHNATQKSLSLRGKSADDLGDSSSAVDCQEKCDTDQHSPTEETDGKPDIDEQTGDEYVLTPDDETLISLVQAELSGFIERVLLPRAETWAEVTRQLAREQSVRASEA